MARNGQPRRTRPLAKVRPSAQADAAPSLSRRAFLMAGAAASAAAVLPAPLAAAATSGGAARSRRGKTGEALEHRPAARPLVVASGNGVPAVERAFALLSEGADPLEAVIAGVNLVEEDPRDYTVGYGGIPNANGVIQLDASCMHGPTHRGGGVAALEGIKTPSNVARLVLERTDHALLVGRGALDFALLHGFREEDLHTPFTRELYAYWKGAVSDLDDYLPPPLESLSPEVQEFVRRYEGEDFFYPGTPAPRGRSDRRRSGSPRMRSFTAGGPADALRPARRNRIRADVYGTINCNAVSAAGALAGVTTTSGLFFKIPGRVGDSPILGAGLYVDNDVGAAGSTGRGEANLLNLSSFLVVERMRSGTHPRDACLDACRRIVENNVEERLRREDGRPNFGVSFYALDKTGRYGSGSIWSGATFAVADERGARKEEAAALYERPED